METTGLILMIAGAIVVCAEITCVMLGHGPEPVEVAADDR